MKKLLVINGVNLNMLGIREKTLYGSESYQMLEEYIKKSAEELEVEVEIFQSNFEGEIVECIQKAYGKFDGIVINAGAYTHTSVAILDALKAVNIKTVEVHLTDINAREEFRKISYISYFAEKQIVGEGFYGYKRALEYLK
ncbi:MAG: type II 3-dehydroquinate dehydratase [Clostridia bacterium]